MPTINGNGIPKDLERTLWAAADKLRGHLDAAEYKHVVLGLIFLKYISDAFHARQEQLAEIEYADPEDPEEYVAANVFYVPPSARWEYLQKRAKDPEIGIFIDDAMLAIERDNPQLKGVLPTDYGREDLNKRRLGELVDLISGITLGTDESRAQDILGRVYEYFLGEFATAEGKKGGQFYTPKSVVRLLVEMLEPYEGRVYDPCCGSGGMFVQSDRFIREHGGNINQISIFGQESNPTTWRLAKMNLSIRGIDHNLGDEPADTFHRDLHPDLRANYILANPPFNMSDWGGNLLEGDPRWRFGTPPANNANFAWMQHIIHHLARDGRAGIVLSNGSMSTQTSGEGEIRQAIVEADMIECMVALPPQLFHNTQIPACLWFLSNHKPEHRRGEVLFIDTRNEGEMVSRTLRDFSDEDYERVTGTYHSWRTGENGYENQPGFCYSATLDEITDHNYVLTPGRYVGVPELKDDDEPFEEKMERLTTVLRQQLELDSTLKEQVRKNLSELGYE